MYNAYLQSWIIQPSFLRYFVYQVCRVIKRKKNRKILLNYCEDAEFTYRYCIMNILGSKYMIGLIEIVIFVILRRSISDKCSVVWHTWCLDHCFVFDTFVLFLINIPYCKNRISSLMIYISVKLKWLVGLVCFAICHLLLQINLCNNI